RVVLHEEPERGGGERVRPKTQRQGHAQPRPPRGGHTPEQAFARCRSGVRAQETPDDGGDEERGESADAGEQERVVARRRGRQRYEFLCECADAGCTERIELRPDEYEWVRSKPTRFVLARGHAAPDIEHVVEVEKTHIVVEKLGLAATVAARLDPRTA